MKQILLAPFLTAGCNINLPRICIASFLFLIGTTSALPDTLNYTGASQTYTVTSSGEYQIIAYGAQGGNTQSVASGGNGAEIGGSFSLTAGEMLNIYVGGSGGSGNVSGGGGGGTFVTGPVNTNPLVVAGGGGGSNQSSIGGAGQTTNSGSSGGTGGTFDGNGGGGGGGFTADGGDATVTAQGGAGTGGKGFPLLTGGTGDSFFGDGNGGFGGGGGGGVGGGGGGGGYSGGDGGTGFNNIGNGGGSFDAGTDQILISGENAGDGFVVITPVVQGTPEPASLAIVGVALVGLYVVGRKRIISSNKSL